MHSVARVSVVQPYLSQGEGCYRRLILGGKQNEASVGSGVVGIGIADGSMGGWY